MELTASSPRSTVAPASSSSLCLAFGISMAESRSMEPQKVADVQYSYDRVADEYVQ